MLYCVSVIDIGVRMVMLPAVQMSALTGGRARLAAAPQYISTLQPAVQNMTGYRWPPANTYAMSLCLVMSSAVCIVSPLYDMVSARTVAIHKLASVSLCILQ